mmetsp:Transcript_52802/g.94258  ORF Transcript_52802/g.94258 Transcript_52802/m.94258 type:complete len:208 (-) Transcript_52802:241-864(-)
MRSAGKPPGECTRGVTTSGLEGRCLTRNCMLISPPSGVNFTALLTKFVKICIRRVWSPKSTSGTSVATSTWCRRCFSASFEANRSKQVPGISWMGMAKDLSSSLPVVILVKSRTSFTMDIRWSPAPFIRTRKSRAVSAWSSSSRRSMSPRTPFRGVRISWDIRARNISWASRASRAAFSAALRTWISSSSCIRTTYSCRSTRSRSHV